MPEPLPEPLPSTCPVNVAWEIRKLNERFARIESIIIRSMLRKESRAEQAKRMRVSRSTVWRRERAERVRQMADGKL
jgi:transcriptional regulator with PAS, ATPase and Fis domain